MKLLLGACLTLIVVTAAPAATLSHVETVTGETPQFGAVLQSWGIDDTSSCRNGKGCLDFRVRRVELSLGVRYHGVARGFVMIDPAKVLSVSGAGTLSPTGDTSILQDLGIAFDVTRGLQIVLGQFLLPTFAEGLMPIDRLPLPEMSLPARTYGYRREPGFEFLYELPSSSFKAAAMLANGQGPNQDSPKSSKDLHVRISWEPPTGFRAGAFTSLVNLSYRQKAAWGANLGYTDGTFSARVEGAYATTPSSHNWGGVGEIAYQFNKELQAVARYEAFEPDTSQSSDLPQAVTAGLNVFVLPGKAQIQFALSSLWKITGNEGTTLVDLTQPRQTLALMAFQLEL